MRTAGPSIERPAVRAGSDEESDLFFPSAGKGFFGVETESSYHQRDTGEEAESNNQTNRFCVHTVLG